MNNDPYLSLHRKLKQLLVGLLIATLITLVWQHYAPDAELRIDGDSGFDIIAEDDRAVAGGGGTSVATLHRDDGRLVMDCLISDGYVWPFCEILITLKEPPQGIDLTPYERVSLSLSIEGPSKPQMRFFVRNFNPAYSDIAQPTSLKVMELLFNATDEMESYSVNLSQMTVSSWWSNEFPTALENVGVEYNNISRLSLSTGGHVVPGEHRIILEHITFSGKRIPDATLRLIIIMVWAISIIGYLLVDKLVSLGRLSQSKKQRQSLERINNALLLESKSFERLAHRDELTGVLNRHGLSQALLDTAILDDPGFYPVALAFMDVDHFKQVNDQYGHTTADKILVELTELIQAGIKKHDLFTRWGGEEFLLVLPDASAEQAVGIIERMHQAIAANPWPDNAKVTCSFGVTQARPGEDLSVAIARADQAMYQAKHKGRNRTEVLLAET